MQPIVCVVGARPNFMKIAPIMRALASPATRWPTLLVHTGQHYDAQMSDAHFASLGIREPDINLAVGSGSHAVQTAEVMRRFDETLDQHDAACVLVVGDVNSTIACSLVAAKRLIPVAHVEAGLRSFDRAMPEEINRVLTDQIADLLYTTEQEAAGNLAREGIGGDRVHFVGNVMIDSLLANLAAAPVASATLQRALGVPSFNKPYALITLHRPSNVDDPATLASLAGTLVEVARRLTVIFPVHPRTRAKLAAAGLEQTLVGAGLHLLDPQPYSEMLGLMRDAKLVLTDSGGIQEETTALGVPCLTARENTERPITIANGTNTLVGRDRARILTCVDDIMATGGKRGRVPPLWDGKAAERIAQHLTVWLGARAKQAA